MFNLWNSGLKGLLTLGMTASLFCVIVGIWWVPKDKLPPQCGVASVYALLKSQGLQVDYRELEAEIPVKDGMASLYDLNLALLRHGVVTVPMTTNVKELRERKLTGVLYLPTGHFVFLKRHLPNGKILVTDPRTPGGLESKVWSYENLRYSGNGLALLSVR